MTSYATPLWLTRAHTLGKHWSIDSVSNATVTLEKTQAGDNCCTLCKCVCIVVGFEIVPSKLKPRSVTTQSQLLSLKWRKSNKMESVFYQFVIEWGQISNYTPSVCENTVINWDKLVEISNLLLSVAAYIHRNSHYTEHGSNY